MIDSPTTADTAFSDAESPPSSWVQKPASAGAGADADSDEVSISAAVAAACARIAPCWPLDRLIAVNPWWGFIDEPMPIAAHRLELLSTSRCRMPLDWYQQRYADGSISDASIAAVLQEHGLSLDAARFAQTNAGNADTSGSGSAAGPGKNRFWLMTDALDHAIAGKKREPTWSSVVRHAIGQHCAMWFDRGQARWRPPSDASMYASWRSLASHDNAPSLLTGVPAIAACIAGLPASATALIEAACEGLGIASAHRERYFTALLLDISGWAGWCAYQRFQQRQSGGDDDSIEHLLAIRLAWDWVLHMCVPDAGALKKFQVAHQSGTDIRHAVHRWIWQAALERTWQDGIHQGLTTEWTAPMAPAEPQLVHRRPALQAAFCIDVRSEPLRRALEACDVSIETHGFAGFFGLPIDFQSLAAVEAEPRLPGPLAPALRVLQKASNGVRGNELANRRRGRLDRLQAWQGFRTAGSGGFGFVETLGLGYAWKLLRSSLGSPGAESPDTMPGLTAKEQLQLHPQFADLPTDQAVDLAAGVLAAMSLQAARLAPYVLLVGHGSQSANNPHAHSLDCGACCGQSGDINARTLAALLNDAAVRTGLAARGIVVPKDTVFIAALHNTTTDDIRLFDTTISDWERAEPMAEVRRWLAQASATTRAERAPALREVRDADPAVMAKRLRARAADWAQVRPEWGLANNAGFIAAPRVRTRGMDLGGRVFLHDYDHTADSSRAVLTLILTAPVVVAHWINMQYYASTVDNAKWGGGNKVLHNVVGGDIGVFEGNGGDLRIGLPLQSLHDGVDWLHHPLRLSVWIEAPPEAIAHVVATQDTVRKLVDGEWLYLFCITPGSGALLRHRSGFGAAADSADRGEWYSANPASCWEQVDQAPMR